MFSPIVLFLLIGLAYWAAHALECNDCKFLVYKNGLALLEGVTMVFGWPLRLMDYILKLASHKSDTKNEAAIAKKIIEQVNVELEKRGLQIKAVEFSQRKDETTGKES